MKQTGFTLKILSVLLFLTGPVANGQNLEISAIALDNEFDRNQLGQLEPIYCNPILLDGKPLDYETFNLKSTGQLSLVSGDPNAPNSELIPFYVQLRRNDVILPVAAINFLNQGSYEIDISKVLAYAKHGDHLIINPTNQKHWKAKRIIKLIEIGC